MKKYFFFFLLFLLFNSIKAQRVENNNSNYMPVNLYRASYPKINDLIHTKLEVSFDYTKAWMFGKVWLTLRPHFYSTDSLTLDAKGMEIKGISILKGDSNLNLYYRYDGFQLFIKLDKAYSKNENYVVFINYTAKPNEIKVKGSDAIIDAKGLYFINPKGEDKDKPIQIWTQGETESNSVWMPTIDKPNQKTTEEIYMTVPSKYVTLSNGVLKSQKQNKDGTRTDYWKMDLPHAPYLFFMGVGDFAIVKDTYKAKEVNYYVEKKYEPVARKIFGKTPAMMKFFSEKLGIDYPWAKYAQMVGRDYVSGAMENTTATLHQESAMQNERQLSDENIWESTIAHELFHQWFGDLVTAESWSNITLNESFANYSEYLWLENSKGKDAADEHIFEDMQGYLQSGNEGKSLVRYTYADKEDVFDNVSYNKGGCILNMLRNYTGDDAFYKSLNNYLMNNKFKTAEAAQLRLAFEEVTGKDLNWFWDQWYFGSGHPKLAVDYKYDFENKKALVIIKQLQKTGKIFRLPIAIDIYDGGIKKRNNVWIENKIDTFTFRFNKKPDLINVDGDKILLCEKTDNKTAENFIYQLKNTANYNDRKEAIDYFSEKGMQELSFGLKDKFAGIRRLTIEKLKESKIVWDADVLKSIETIANIDKDNKTRAAAIRFLAATGEEKYKSIYAKNIDDSSYTIAGASLDGWAKLEPDKAYVLAKQQSPDAKGDLADAVSNILMQNGIETDYEFIANAYKESAFSLEKLDATEELCTYLEKINDIPKVKKAISYILKYRERIPKEYKMYTEPTFKYWLGKLSKVKGGEVAKYISEEFK